jgi:hypothetical protein
LPSVLSFGLWVADITYVIQHSGKGRRTLVLTWRRRSFLADALRQIAVAIRSAYPVPTPPGLTS